VPSCRIGRPLSVGLAMPAVISVFTRRIMHSVQCGIAINPGLTDAHVNLGGCFSLTRRREQAIRITIAR